MRRFRAAHCVASLLCVAFAAPTTSAQAVVTGVVRDSISGRPFASATIELVPTLAPWMAGFSTRSDSTGRFSITDVAPGTYFFGFLHPRLDSLGMDQVTRTLTVKPAQNRLTADLALPSARTLSAMLCNTRRDDRGALLGRVYDARDGRAVSSGTVLVRWGELRADVRGVRNDAAERSAVVRSDGRFLACNVPTDAPLLVQAVAGDIATPSWVQPRTTSGLIELSFAYDTPLLQRNLFVAPVTTDSVVMPAGDSVSPPLRRGTARLLGRIRSDDGHPVAGARVLVREAGAEGVTDSSGAFRITGLPLGTHNVEVIALGYVPMRSAVDMRPDVDVTAEFMASRRVQTLDEVTVRDRRDHTGFLKRRKQGNGFFLDAADIDRRSVLTLPMVLSSAPMLRINGVSLTGQPMITGRNQCTPTVYVDGLVMAAGLGQALDATVLRDVGGIEVYASAAETPPQFSAGKQIFLDAAGRDRGAPNLNAMCATIVIWTKALVR